MLQIIFSYFLSYFDLFTQQASVYLNFLGIQVTDSVVLTVALGLMIVETCLGLLLAIKLVSLLIRLLTWLWAFLAFRLFFGEWRQWDAQLRKQQARLVVNPELQSWANTYLHASDRIGVFRDEIAKDTHTYQEKEYSSFALAKKHLYLRWRKFQYRLAWKTAKRLGFPYFQNMQDYITMSTESINAHLGVGVKKWENKGVES